MTDNNLYFQQLRKHLFGLSEDERDDVVQFYQEYASDGDLHGAALISKFGTPKQLARRVLVDYSIRYDDVAEADVDYSESLGVRETKRVKRQLNLLWVIVIGLLTSVVWIPAAFAILLALFLTIALALAVAAVLVGAFVTGLFAIAGGISIFAGNWAIGMFHIGFGLFLVGIQLIAWPIAWFIVHAVFVGLIKLVKKIGRKFSKANQGGVQNA